MPRVSVLRQINRNHLTPFAALIYDYLVSFQPSMTVGELAAECGISANAITSWLKHGVLPMRKTIVQLAGRTEGLDLEELLEAAGLPSTAEIRARRIADLDRLRASVALVEDALMNDPELSDHAKAIIRADIDKLRGLPDQFVRDTDTYREWNLTSPTEFQAERAADTAQIVNPDDDANDEQSRRTKRPTHPEQPRERRPTDA